MQHEDKKIRLILDKGIFEHLQKETIEKEGECFIMNIISDGSKDSIGRIAIDEFCGDEKQAHELVKFNRLMNLAKFYGMEDAVSIKIRPELEEKILEINLG